jgi:hypothetical protein
MTFSPYQKKNPGDVLKLQDWLAVQRRIKEELRAHRHLGNTSDGDVDPGRIGSAITSSAFAPGAVAAGKIAAGAVGAFALADGAVRSVHLGVDERLPEAYLKLRPSGGHNHDGVGSRSLPEAVVATRQLRDRSISEIHFEGAPGDNDLSPDEDIYARGRGFTPGNVLRAVRQLMEHIGFQTRPLLVQGQYRGIAGTPMTVLGFSLENLPDPEDGERAGDFVAVELRIPSRNAVGRALAEILDERTLRATVPNLGAQEAPGYLLVVRGDGSTVRPYTPVTNAVPFTYQPPAKAVAAATLRKRAL